MHTDYRKPKRTYATAFNAVRTLHFFKLAFASGLAPTTTCHAVRVVGSFAPSLTHDRRRVRRILPTECISWVTAAVAGLNSTSPSWERCRGRPSGPDEDGDP